MQKLPLSLRKSALKVDRERKAPMKSRIVTHLEMGTSWKPGGTSPAEGSCGIPSWKGNSCWGRDREGPGKGDMTNLLPRQPFPSCPSLLHSHAPSPASSPSFYSCFPLSLPFSTPFASPFPFHSLPSCCLSFIYF